MERRPRSAQPGGAAADAAAQGRQRRPPGRVPASARTDPRAAAGGADPRHLRLGEQLLRDPGRGLLPGPRLSRAPGQPARGRPVAPLLPGAVSRRPHPGPDGPARPAGPEPRPPRRAADRLFAGRQPLAQISGRDRPQWARAPRRDGLGAARSGAQLPLADALAQLSLSPLHPDPSEAQLHRPGGPAQRPRTQGDPQRRVALAARRRLHRATQRLRRRPGLLRRQLEPELPGRDPRPDAPDPRPGRPLRAGGPLSPTALVGRGQPDAALAQERRPPRLPRSSGVWHLRQIETFFEQA